MELYAGTALPLLMPAVEAGVANASWRIRQSSVELLGDLLFKASGWVGGVCFRVWGVGVCGGWRGLVSSCWATCCSRWVGTPPPPPDERRPHPPTLSTHAHHTHPAQVAGATGRIQQDLTNEEEEGLSTESHGQALIDALGMDK